MISFFEAKYQCILEGNFIPTLNKFTLHYITLHSFCLLNKECLNVTENVHEVSFPNIYVLSHIIYYNVPLTTIIALAIKAVGFSMVTQIVSTIFAMHYDDIKDFLLIFLFEFFIISDHGKWKAFAGGKFFKTRRHVWQEVA